MKLNKLMRDIVNATDGRYIGGAPINCAPAEIPFHALKANIDPIPL